MGYRAELTGSRGFTLLELVVTLSVLALAVGLAVPTIARSTDAIRARADVAGFSALLRHARERAIVTRKSQAVVVDPAARRVSLVAGGPEGDVRETRRLPERLRIEADPPPALVVRFEPQGGGSGGDFRLSSGRVVYRVRVDALTGRVRSSRE
jgi:prepilin-type N-terminal cleavage/methylation domain-containing protein